MRIGFTKPLALLIALQASFLSAAELANSSISWNWQVESNHLRQLRLDDRMNQATLALTSECFRLVLGDGSEIKCSDFALEGPPGIEVLKADPASPVAARHFPGRQLTARFTAPDKHLSDEWRAVLRDGSTYLRQELTLRAVGQDVQVNEIVLFEQPVAEAKTTGTADGSPVVAGNFFFGYEHPMAGNTVGANGVVRCAFLRNAVLKDGETLTQSCVLGAVPRGQLRRGFLAYLERERAHPYRPFLHYNSWYDIAWDNRKFNETESLDAINAVGRELAQRRGVQLDSYLFDDGWDDNKTLWQFHSGFPNGFTPLQAAAAKFNTSIGVWLSPFGGYATARAQRLNYASQFGFETNSSGFSLAGPKYYQRFHDICLDMVRKYGVNQFKFDGLAAGSRASAAGLTRDGDAMLRLVADLRAAKPDIFINQTTGTWPSPFWLLYVDTTWRGGYDHSFAGEGANRQRWINYRDQQTYHGVVQQGPLYPLNSLMLHGIIYATNADRLDVTSDQDFADEVHDFFGGGTQLQELYITSKLLSTRNWDDLAEAAKWSRANADVLVDTHWVGGDPGQGEVYGWASWSPRKAILTLRNPKSASATFTADAQDLFQLPVGANKSYTLRSPWKADQGKPPMELTAGQPHVFTLQPFEVEVLESAGR